MLTITVTKTEGTETAELAKISTDKPLDEVTAALLKLVTPPRRKNRKQEGAK